MYLSLGNMIEKLQHSGNNIFANIYSSMSWKGQSGTFLNQNYFCISSPQDGVGPVYL